MALTLIPKYTVDLIIDDGHHYYTVKDGQLYLRGMTKETWLPGSTGILAHISKPALVPWAAKIVAHYCASILRKTQMKTLTERFFETLIKRAKKQPQFVKEAAARIGSLAHAQFDDHIKTGKKPNIETIEYKSFLHWLGKEDLKIVDGDLKVASISLGYGGSLDAIAEGHDGKLVVIDFKTGKSLYKEHAYQVASYAKAFQEQYGLDYCPSGVLLRFDKEKVLIEKRKMRDPERSFKGFLAALELYHADRFDHFSSREILKEWPLLHVVMVR